MIERLVRIYFILFFFLVLFGMVMVFSIDVFNVAIPATSVTSILIKQFMKFVIAVSGFILALTIDFQALRKRVPIILLATFLLILATFIIGTSVNGSRRWINLGVMMIQPSEFAKITAVIYLASVIANKGNRLGLLKELLYPFIVVGAMSGIIAIEDLGTGLIIAVTMVVLLLMGGMKFRYVAVLLVLGPLLIAAMIYMPGREYRRVRIAAYLDTDAYPDENYQQIAAKIAMGRGGITGVGFGNSERKQKFLPEARTDFIFGVIGEEFGFIGTLTLVILFSLFFSIGVFFVANATTQFNMYIIAGFVFMMGSQTFINMGVVTTLLPNKGVPLPFISHG
ncbi:FtsW/RodA/SpoVE family cell cycle protein, partial [bacterium]|nr:FtsW/RodA/SpoVE family cell cycle protein [bacterium]